MALYDYLWSRYLDSTLESAPFYALIMLAMRRADTDNLAALERAFPGIAQELRARYHAPAGLLESDRLTTDQALEIGEGIRQQARAIFRGRQ